MVFSKEYPGLLAYVNPDRRFYLSGVNFNRARSIRFSTGDEGRCRTRQDLCGMLIQFWDIDHALVLGQWIRELEDTRIELQQGEQLTELGVWYSRASAVSVPKRSADNDSRVAGIRVATSRGQQREVHVSHASPTFVFCYRQNMFEEIVRFPPPCSLLPPIALASSPLTQLCHSYSLGTYASAERAFVEF